MVWMSDGGETQLVHHMIYKCLEELYRFSYVIQTDIPFFQESPIRSRDIFTFRGEIMTYC